MLQYLLGECDCNNVIGDKRMAELALLGEVRKDLTLEEMISYNGKFPLWKRIMVALWTIQVSLVMYSYLWITLLAGTQQPSILVYLNERLTCICDL